MRRRLCFLSLLTATLFAAGCSSNKVASVYTFSQRDGGNVAASDAVGSGMSLQGGVQTAWIPEEGN